nr:MAG TPA: hypothetical protein [Caudoviricetes sp.]
MSKWWIMCGSRVTGSLKGAKPLSGCLPAIRGANA